MSERPGTADGRLRDAFGPADRGAADGRQTRCPGDATIWRLAGGGLPASRLAAVLEHARGCEACSTSLRLAAGLAREGADAGVAQATREARAARAAVWLGPLAAAALAALLIFPLVEAPAPAPASTVRGPSATPLRSLLEPGRPLPRERFVLRWTPGPEGTLYRLEVVDGRLEPLHAAGDLERASHRVPAAALAAVPAGQPVLWRVVAVTPGAGHLESPIFRTFVE